MFTRLQAAVVALAITLGGARAAAQPVVPLDWYNPSGVFNSWGPLGSVNNGGFEWRSSSWSTMTTLHLSATLAREPTVPDSWASEARVVVTTPDGGQHDFQVFTQQAFECLTVTDYLLTIPTGTRCSGTWQLRFYESHVDNPAGRDAVWSNVVIQLDGWPILNPPQPIVTVPGPSAHGAAAAESPLSDFAVAWFKITVPEVIADARSTWLDMDTYGSTPAPSSQTVIGFFTADGRLLAQDDWNMPSWAASLSFGQTSPVRSHSVGIPYGDGANGWLAPGVYYVAVGSPPASFNEAATPFFATMPGPASGVVRLNVFTSQTGPCSLADVTGIGGPPASPDGILTGDDFVAFINEFSAGCP